ncbi:Gfo/Idh/MocA family protein [Paenibacillus sp. SAFN-054]|uniref:Gfo/Idh/MocA family protein n=1 Tax=Paenibacillus sp. SAFN-054 TaxID=3436865 RepID=UPI003F816C9D
MMRLIRFGTIGTNWITERFLHAAEENDDFKLTAVYSRTEDKGREFAAQFGSPKVYTDLTAMASSDEIDAVYIASPNSFHAEQAILCMNHGKHVLCEKPLATNSAEVRRMIEAAEKNQVVLMEALKSTLMPNFKIMKENLYKIGQVRRYFAGYCQYSSRYDAFKEGTVLNAFNPEYSNGALMDLGIYCIYPMVSLFGKPEAVKAVGVMLSSGVDGEGSLVMRYPDMDAVVMYSKISDSFLPAEIQGENGTMVIDRINQPYDVKIQYRDGSIENLTQQQIHESMYYELEEFIRMIGRGKLSSKINSHETSIAVAEVMEDARRQIGLKYAADAW